MLRLWIAAISTFALHAAVAGVAHGACGGTALHDFYAARVVAERNRNTAMDAALHDFYATMDATTRNYAAAVAEHRLRLDGSVAAERNYNGARNAAIRKYKAAVDLAMRNHNDALDAAMRDCFAAEIKQTQHDRDAIVGPRLKRIFEARNAVRRAAWDDLVAAIRAARRDYDASPKTERDRRARDEAINAARRDYGTALGVWR